MRVKKADWWLKYHLRRPAEAMALQKIDYDKDQDAFSTRRTFSARKLIDQMKTKKQPLIPCHSEFKKIIQKMLVYIISPYLFVNRGGRPEGKPYQYDAMEDLWHTTCEKVSEDIDMYSGLNHSSCSQYINEKDYSTD